MTRRIGAGQYKHLKAGRIQRCRPLARSYRLDRYRSAPPTAARAQASEDIHAVPRNTRLLVSAAAYVGIGSDHRAAMVGNKPLSFSPMRPACCCGCGRSSDHPTPIQPNCMIYNEKCAISTARGVGVLKLTFDGCPATRTLTEDATTMPPIDDEQYAKMVAATARQFVLLSLNAC